MPRSGDAPPGNGDFGPFALLLAIDVPPEPAPLAPEAAEQEERLAAAITERFEAAPPDASTVPSVALEVLNLMAQPGVGTSDLTALVSRDPALSAGVLSAANSAAYRGVSEIETVREAMARLGLVEVGRIAAAVSMRALFGPRQSGAGAAPEEQRRALLVQAIAVASAAAAFALDRADASSDRVYLGGLLHHVGKLAAVTTLARLQAEGSVAPADTPTIDRAIDRVHVRLGVTAHAAWKLPQYLSSICERHHDDELPATPEAMNLHLVRLVSALAELRHQSFGARAAREIAQSAAALRLDPFAVRALATELKQAERRARSFAS